MKKYGDMKSVKKRVRYLKKIYRQSKSPIDRERISKSLIANLNLLHFHTRFVHLSVDKYVGNVFKDYITLIRDVKYRKINRRFPQEESYMDAPYLSFLMRLANDVAAGELMCREIPSSVSLERDESVNGAKSFYFSLQDRDISLLADKILSDRASIYFFKRRNETLFTNSKLFDPVFHKPYICILEHHDLRDLFTLIRECALGVKFYMKEDLHCDSFQNVCAYVMEELAFSYFETNETHREDIELLKKQRESDFTGYANDTLMQIHSLPGQQNLKSFFHPNVNEILKVIPRQLKKDLVEIQAYVMARGLVQQIQFNKELGLEHLKTLMRMNISNEQRPDFEKIGLGDDVLLTLAQEMSMRSKNVYSCYHEKKR